MRYWFDTEFIERGPEHPIRLLSIGIVCEDGRELYCEIGNADALIRADFKVYGDSWLTENVLPHLGESLGSGMTRDEIMMRILAFIGDDKPEFWAYFADYDWVVLCQIFGRMVDLPKGWPMHCLDLKQEMKSRGVRREQLPEQGDAEHSALNDARWTRDAYNFVTTVAPRSPQEDANRKAFMRQWLHVFAPNADGLGCVWVNKRGARCGYPAAEYCHIQPSETVPA